MKLSARYQGGPGQGRNLETLRLNWLRIIDKLFKGINQNYKLNQES